MPAISVLYAAAIFLGSFLLFLLEPMAGKRLLPLLGGSSAVWTTCLVFFQTALLLGYLCAHWVVRLPARAQASAYAGMLMAGLAQGWFALNPALHASTSHPIASVFLLLSVLIGFPFLVLSTTGPLLQSWYAQSFASGTASLRRLAPPYRLFALSNFGSLLALAMYPWLIEPHFNLRTQGLIWLWGFLGFSLACCGIMSLGRGAQPPSAGIPSASTEGGDDLSPLPCVRDRMLWLLLAACASLVFCAVTNQLCSNIAAIPLLWILPLAVYLLSFVVAFSRGAWYPRLLSLRIPVLGVSVARMTLLSFLAVTLVWVGRMLRETRRVPPIRVSVVSYCLALFVICLFCHGELHRLRPSPRHLTSFYLLIAAGGALGSLFVGVLAPLIFRANYELVCGLVFAAMMALAVTWNDPIGWRLLWSALTVFTVVLVAVQARNLRMDAIVQLRNFYGTLRVTQEFAPPAANYTRRLYHGMVEHGNQVFSADLRRSPTSYYGHDSGVGLALDFCCGDRERRVGIIGLGTGTLAAYGRKGDVFRFYDINLLVVRLAHNLFTYLRESPATIQIVEGDARLSLAAEPPQHYDVLVVDAFSGDAIPVHLLTSQALDLYRRHLQPGGILAVHVSNKFLRLAPVVAEEAEHAGLQTAYIRSDDDEDTATYSADWVLVTANREFLARPQIAGASSKIDSVPGLRLWTDDYNGLLPILK